MSEEQKSGSALSPGRGAGATPAAAGGLTTACARIAWEGFNLPLMEEVLEAANHDGDVASCFVLGDSFEESLAMLFVVKGREQLLRVRELLIAEGFLTDGKRVLDPRAECSAHGFVVDGKTFDPLAS